MNEELANEMINRICEWLKVGAPTVQRQYIYESASSDLAREMSYKLLDAADADGEGGCRLCQS